METGISIIKSTFTQLKGKFVKAFIGAMVYLTPLLLFCLIPYVGWAISVVLFGHFTVGLIKYINSLLKDEEVKLITIFELRPNISAVTLLGAIVILLALLGGILFLVPGLIVIAYYSMSLFVQAQENSSNVLEVLRKSAQLSKGNKTSMLTYKIIFYVIYALVILLSIFIYLAIEQLYLTLPILSIALTILLAVVLLLGLSAVTACFAVSNQLFYNKIATEPVKVEVKEEVSEVVEEVKQEEKVEVKEETPVTKTKTTTNKANTSKPKTTTTKKSTTKKTTTKE